VTGLTLLTAVTLLTDVTPQPIDFSPRRKDAEFKPLAAFAKNNLILMALP